MHTPDWSHTQALKDAAHCDALMRAADAKDAEQAQQAKFINTACDAIRRLDLGSDQLEQLLATLGSTMAARGYIDHDVQAVDGLAACLCGVAQ